METREVLLIQASRDGFKSHHSGMETFLYRIGWRGRFPLNRTIVGWKRATGGPAGVRRVPLNRTIVGWKQVAKLWVSVGADTLNRTIVGWKRRTRLRTHFTADPL